MEKGVLKELIRKTIESIVAPTIPIGVSNRHIHLSGSDYDRLFPRELLRPKKALAQPGEFAAEQTVTLVGPRGTIERVRLLGPLRAHSQVEVSQTDARALGIAPPVALSGDLSKAAPITIKTAHGQITLPCCIIAKRHIHVAEADSSRLGVHHGDTVAVRMISPQRTTVYEDVIIRVSPDYVTEMHIDTDEANAAQISNGDTAYIVR